MNRKITRLGFIGLGRMGKPMAIDLLKTGYDLAVYAGGAEPLQELAALGAKVGIRRSVSKKPCAGARNG
jgi:3-hydroxyisobutyrate dehydrogenase-like beta-hydroxyacid dehydrogenase